MSQHIRRHRRTAAVAAAAVGCTVLAGAWFSTGPASAGAITGSLYRDPNSQAARWVAANPSDSRMPVIRDKIASQPAAHWLSSFNLTTVQSEVSTFVGAAASANQIPVLSVYEITNRDCGGASAGGAPSLAQYQTWINSFSAGLGNRPVIVILETDALALQTCLSASDVTARDQALATAVQTIKAADSGARVYLDGGHSAWNSASDQANRLKAAGVQYADGFFTNVSNFNSTANEAAYGRSIISALNGLGTSGKHQIIDTSRNGGAGGDWCADDNTDRRIGAYPTTNTGDANIDAYLWVKPPGEADGCSYTAGSFQPNLAYSLASSAPYPPTESPTAPPTTPSTTPPTSTPPTSNPPTSNPPTSNPPTSAPPTTPPPTTPAGGACTAAYQTTNSWPGGFQAQVTVTAGRAAINGWTVRWTLASGQSISQLWNGTLSVSGSSVTVKNLSYNGSLAAGGSTQFGFTGTGSAATPALTCTSP
ncbi:glycoside hydrolase family 6 protein [Rugosimonospora africana]|uniref:Glucanase n=1 Tax=Rugosimonospora africana TaxID=556532 RepID=A0A8J3QQL2_9ACTN|nr:glycoside hydrolase family 6 protein [Rugosimonospora africana]GIH14507.1 glucanase [Rugosimonospora africana]